MTTRVALAATSDPAARPARSARDLGEDRDALRAAHASHWPALYRQRARRKRAAPHQRVDRVGPALVLDAPHLGEAELVLAHLELHALDAELHALDALLVLLDAQLLPLALLAERERRVRRQPVGQPSPRAPAAVVLRTVMARTGVGAGAGALAIWNAAPAPKPTAAESSAVAARRRRP